MSASFKRRVFDIIGPSNDAGVVGRMFDFFITFLILLSVVIVFAVTFDIPPDIHRHLLWLEGAISIIFTVEFLLRIWTARYLYPDLTPFRATVKYVFSAMAVVDLIAILPFYLPFIMPSGFLGLRALRLVRLLRIFKLNRHFEALAAIGEVVKDKSKDIVASLFFVFLMIIISSLLIYAAEHDAQPNVFKNAFSALWWAIATLTTVGIDGIEPITLQGRILGACISILGVGLVAIPAGIISSGLIERLDQRHRHDDSPTFCPHCGKRIWDERKCT